MKSIIAVVAMSFVGSAFAATDGEMGTTSTGQMDIILKVPSFIQLTQMKDIILDNVTDQKIINSVKVETNSQWYDVDVSFTNDKPMLTSSEHGDTIPYKLKLVSSHNGEVAYDSEAGVQRPIIGHTAEVNAMTTNLDIHFQMAEDMSVLKYKQMGTYKDTVTITLSVN